MSNIEDDSASLRMSLRSQDPSVASVPSSTRTSLSAFIFDFDREVTATNSRLAPSPRRSPEACAPHLVSGKSDNTEKESAQSVATNKVFGTGSLSYGRFRKLLTQIRGTPSLTPLRNIVRNRSPFPPILKVSQEVHVTETPKELNDPDTIKVLLLGAGGSGKTSLMHSIELLCTGKLYYIPWYTAWLMFESAVERMLNILDFMQVNGIPFAASKSDKYTETLFQYNLWWNREPMKKRTARSDQEGNGIMSYLINSKLRR